MPADRAGQYDFFEIPALADEVLHGFLVGDAADVLLDDGAFIKLSSDVVAGGADDFDTAMVGGMIGFCSGKSGQEAVVDVDDPIRPRGANVVGKNLHVAGEDDGLDLVLVEQGQLFRLGLRFVFLRDRNDVKGDAEPFCGRAQCFVVGNDEGDVCFEFPCFVAAEEVVEAMSVFADEEGQPVPDI